MFKFNPLTQKLDKVSPNYYSRDAVNGIIYPRLSTDKEYLFNNKQIYSNSDDALIKNLSFYKSRGTYDSPSVITTGDYLGEMVGYGHDGTNYIRSASIRFKSEGTVSTNRIPSSIEFWTGTNASPSVETRKFVIDQNGTLWFTGTLFADNGLIDARKNNIQTTSTTLLSLANITSATLASKVQMSPRIQFRGTAWDTDDAVSRTTDWIMENLPVSGDTVSSTLKFGHSLAGASYTYPMTLTSNGALTVSNAVYSNTIDASTNLKVGDGYSLQNRIDANRFTLYGASSTTSAYISRNTADAYSAFAINNANASSTGNILDLQWQGTNRISFTKNGSINLNTTDNAGAGTININGNRYFHAYSPVTADYNLFVGYNSGNFTMSGTGEQASYNTGLGRTTLEGLTTGSYNTAVGFQSLRNNTSGGGNTAYGMYSLLNNTTVSNLTAVGYDSLRLNTTGTGLVAVGYQAGRGNVKGTNNSYFGYQAGYSGTTVVSSIAITNGGTGYTAGALIVNNTGTGGSGLAGTYTVDGSGTINGITITNVGSGYNSVPTVTPQPGGSSAVLTPVLDSASYNTANGAYSLYSNTTGYRNTANGYASLYSNTTGYNNTANGAYSLYSNTTGSSNTALGYNSGRNNTSGGNNVYIGVESAYKSGVTATGSGNVFMGYQTGINNTASNNVFIGYQAGYNNTSASGNTYVGYKAGYAGVTAQNNSVFGENALLDATGSENSAFGQRAGSSLTTGTYNTFLGKYAGYHASQKVDATNSMALGYGAYTDASNLCQIGNSSLTLVRSAGDFECSTADGGVILKSPDGTRYKIKVENGGTLTVVAA